MTGTTPKSQENINIAADNAIHVIAQAANEAAKVIASAAADASKVVNIKGSDDHDLLIRLDTKLNNLKDDIKDLKDGVAHKIQCLEAGKAEKVDLNKLEKFVEEVGEPRIKSLEMKTANYFLTLSLYTLLQVATLGLIVYHLFQIPK